MLNKKTKALMRVIYDKAISSEGTCLMGPIEMLSGISFKLDFAKEELDPSLKWLASEGYFEIIETAKKGERVYCITLQKAGYEFARQIQSDKRAIKFKIALTIGGVILSFILGRILAAIAS